MLCPFKFDLGMLRGLWTDILLICQPSSGRLIPWEVVLTILSQVAAGLRVVHDCGIIHRDVKADNVFVVSRDPLVLKLGDLGLSHVLSTAGASNRQVGLRIQVGNDEYF